MYEHLRQSRLAPVHRPASQESRSRQDPHAAAQAAALLGQPTDESARAAEALQQRWVPALARRGYGKGLTKPRLSATKLDRMAAQWQQRRSGPAFEEDGSTSEEDGPTLEEARAEIALDLTDAWQEASGESGPPPNLPRGYGNTPWRWYHYATLALGGAAAVGLYSGHRYFAGTSESSSEPTPPPAAETMNPGEPTASGSQIPASSPRPPLAVPSQTLPAHLIRAHAASTAHSQQNQADTIEGSANNGMVAYRTAGNPRMEARATPFSWRNFKDHNHTRHVPEMCRITGLVRHTIKIKCDKNPYFSEYLISVEAKAGDGRDFKGIVESDWNGNRLSCDSQEHSVGLHHFLSTRTIGVEPPIRAKDVLAGPVGWSKLKVIPILRDDPEATSTTEGLSTFQEDISGKESPLPAEPNPQHMPELILPRFKTEIKSAGHVSILPEGCEISAPYREYHAKTLSVRCDRTPLFDTMMITLKARHKDGRRITHQAQGRADGNYYSMSLQESVGELLHGSSWTSELIVTPIRQTEQDKDPSETHHPSPSTPEESDEMLAPDSFDKIPGALSETGGGVKFQKGMSVGGAALSYLNAWAAYKNDDEPIDQASAYIGALGETLNTGGQYIPKGKWLGDIGAPIGPVADALEFEAAYQKNDETKIATSGLSLAANFAAMANPAGMTLILPSLLTTFHDLVVATEDRLDDRKEKIIQHMENTLETGYRDLSTPPDKLIDDLSKSTSFTMSVEADLLAECHRAGVDFCIRKTSLEDITRPLARELAEKCNTFIEATVSSFENYLDKKSADIVSWFELFQMILVNPEVSRHGNTREGIIEGIKEDIRRKANEFKRSHTERDIEDSLTKRLQQRQAERGNAASPYDFGR